MNTSADIARWHADVAARQVQTRRRVRCFGSRRTITTYAGQGGEIATYGRCPGCEDCI
jgi:hypothetical protein